MMSQLSAHLPTVEQCRQTALDSLHFVADGLVKGSELHSKSGLVELHVITMGIMSLFAVGLVNEVAPEYNGRATLYGFGATFLEPVMLGTSHVIGTLAKEKLEELRAKKS